MKTERMDRARDFVIRNARLLERQLFASFLARLFERPVLDRHLAALAARQHDDGSWPISWDTVSPGVTLEWRGRMTIQALRTLEAYQA